MKNILFLLIFLNGFVYSIDINLPLNEGESLLVTSFLSSNEIIAISSKDEDASLPFTRIFLIQENNIEEVAKINGFLANRFYGASKQGKTINVFISGGKCNFQNSCKFSERKYSFTLYKITPNKKYIELWNYDLKDPEGEEMVNIDWKRNIWYIVKRTNDNIIDYKIGEIPKNSAKFTGKLQIGMEENQKDITEIFTEQPPEVIYFEFDKPYIGIVNLGRLSIFSIPPDEKLRVLRSEKGGAYHVNYLPKNKAIILPDNFGLSYSIFYPFEHSDFLFNGGTLNPDLIIRVSDLDLGMFSIKELDIGKILLFNKSKLYFADLQKNSYNITKSLSFDDFQITGISNDGGNICLKFACNKSKNTSKGIWLRILNLENM